MEVLSIQDIDFWNYHSDNGTKLLFDIYHNIKQEKIGDILICRDNDYNLCLKFQNDYFLTISIILSRLKNLSHFYAEQNAATYFTNDDYDYHVYKQDNSYILIVNHHNITSNDNYLYFKERSEYIRDNNLKNIENIIKNN